MRLGNRLFHARKKHGLSQEDVAGKLGVSRQTVSKWETDETLPDIRQAKQMARLYNLSLDELIEFDVDLQEIQEAIERTSAELEEKIDYFNLKFVLLVVPLFHETPPYKYCMLYFVTLGRPKRHTGRPHSRWPKRSGG